MLGRTNASFQGGGKGGAEQRAAVGEGELFAGVQDGTVRGVLGRRAKLGDIGDSLFQGETLGVIAVFDGQAWHRQTSLFFPASSSYTLLSLNAKIERSTRPGKSA